MDEQLKQCLDNINEQLQVIASVLTAAYTPQINLHNAIVRNKEAYNNLALHVKDLETSNQDLLRQVQAYENELQAYEKGDK